MAKRMTPEVVTELSRCEIFVFGSNLDGLHMGGAARTAYEEFGAEWGVGVGPTGRCYAIPTMQGGIETIRPYVNDFIEYAKTHPNNRFLVTRVGCGIAGFTDKQMAPLFQEAFELPNVNFPKNWWSILALPGAIDAFCGCPPIKKSVKIPQALTEQDLMRLCEQYKYVIGAGILAAPKPDIMIRYVIDKGRFGYAKFGDFFFVETGDLYVWTRAKEFEEDHNQDIVEGFFNDECRHRGYCHKVIFAGVKTPFHDSNGEAIYTGDVLRVLTSNTDISDDAFMKYSDVLAFGTLGKNSDGRSAYYCFPLDNHCVTPDMVARWERVGTVFYQLDWCDESIDVTQRCFMFQDIYGTGPSPEDKLVMVRYTPNFDKEEWKYLGLDIIGCVEFNWRK